MKFPKAGRGVAMLAIVAGTGLGFAGTASAAPYDGVAPQGSACYASRALMRQTIIKYGSTRQGDIQLWYSLRCHTVWARVVTVDAPRVTGRLGSRGFVVRNTDHAGQMCNVPVGQYSCLTKMLYDGKVTSYAWAHTNGTNYGRTSNY